MFGLRKRVSFLKQYPEAGAWLQVQACLHNNLCVKATSQAEHHLQVAVYGGDHHFCTPDTCGGWRTAGGGVSGGGGSNTIRGKPF